MEDDWKTTCIRARIMSGKMGKRSTGNKPDTTRRHDSLADGATGRESIDNTRAGAELNRKVAGVASKQHSRSMEKGKKNNG